jgi:ankyrin repeat protein
MPRRLPPRPDLDHLRHQAKDLLRAAQDGDPKAAARIRRVAEPLALSSAQLALARSYGFASWTALKTEVERRAMLEERDLSRLTVLLAEQPAQAAAKLTGWRDHRGASPLAFVAMLRFDTGALNTPGDEHRTGAVARALLAAGAPADGDPQDSETPLITAASYGDAEVAAALIEAGADLEARAAPNAGGVPGATALLQAAVFGMTAIVDLLVAAGAAVDSLETAAAAGDVTGWLSPDTDLQARLRALVFAADHQRLAVIDRLLQAGTPVDQADAEFGRQALQVAAQHGRPASVALLLARGADPDRRDPVHHRTALAWCSPEHRYLDHPGHREAERLLRPVTAP